MRELRELQRATVVVIKDGHTVAQAVEEWLTFGLSNRDSATQAANRYLCEKHVKSRRSARRGKQWQDTELVFTTAVGTEMDSANVRRDLRRALALAPGLDPDEWTPPAHVLLGAYPIAGSGSHDGSPAGLKAKVSAAPTGWSLSLADSEDDPVPGTDVNSCV